MSIHGLADSEMISALYRAFLGREPEPPALAHYMEALAEGSLDAKALIAAFQNCEEYRQRQSTNHLWMPAGHFYSPIANVEELQADAARVFDRSRRPAGIDLNEAGQLALLPMLSRLARDLPLKRRRMDCFIILTMTPMGMAMRSCLLA